MPMIGSDIRMPQNAELAKIYKDFLLEDGLTMTNFAQMAAQDAGAASGAYRKIMTMPEDVVFDIV